MPDSEIVTNPIDILRRLAPADPHRPPWKGWVGAVYEGKGDPGSSAQVLATLNVLCQTIDRFAAGAGFEDVALTTALANDLIALNGSRGQLVVELEKATVIGLGNVMAKVSPAIPAEELRELSDRCRATEQTLGGVSNESAPVAAAAAQALRLIQSDLDRALSTGLLFADPVILTERARGICAYGLTLQREGAAREAALVLSIAVTLIGLVPALAIPAAVASITWALAERVNEQEILGRRAAKRLSPSDPTDASE